MRKLKLRIRRKILREEVIEKIISTAGLSRGKRTPNMFTKKQLIELEIYIRRAESLIGKFTINQ